MHRQSLILICALCATTILASCKNYSVSINQNTVYTPASLFKNFTISDANLRNCVEQTIADKRITKTEELTQLNCSNAGITSITGLEIFSSIKQLNLSENALTSVSQLRNLTQLNTLILRKNNLTSAEPLLHLLHLRELDISENKNIQCGDLQQLLSNFSKDTFKASLPEQCKIGG